MEIVSGISNKYNRYGEELNTHDLFKFAAIVIMTIDHLGFYIFPEHLWLRAIGRITFPVWFFLVGYAKNLSIKKDILLLALIMVPLKLLALKTLLPFNALATIILCRIIIQYMDKNGWIKKYPLAILALSVILVLPTGALCEYGTQGLLYACMGYMVRNDLKYEKYRLFFIITFLLFFLMQIASFHFNTPKSVFVFLATAFVTWLLSEYKVQTFPMRWHGVRNVIKFLSRYSLYYYTIHITFLQALYVWLDPARYKAMHFHIIL